MEEPWSTGPAPTLLIAGSSLAFAVSSAVTGDTTDFYYLMGSCFFFVGIARLEIQFKATRDELRKLALDQQPRHR